MISVNIAQLKGPLDVIDSKSILHRYLILAAFTKQKTTIYSTLQSQDIKATCHVLKAMGAQLDFDGQKYEVTGISTFLKTQTCLADCYDSGSTLRFLIPFACLFDTPFTFIGSQQLAQRSLKSYDTFFSKYQIEYTKQNIPELSLTIKGLLETPSISIDASHSSQFVSGLLMMTPFSKNVRQLTLINNSVSYPYISLTLQALSSFGIQYQVNNNQYTLLKRTAPLQQLHVEKDFSQAAFFLVANKLGCQIMINGLNKDSVQADAKIVSFLDQVNDDLTGDYTFDLIDCPDLGPILMVLACAINGHVTFLNTKRLFDKESNRLTTMLTNLDLMGVTYQNSPDKLIIDGQHKKYDGNFIVETKQDHRIIMAMTIASYLCKQPILFESIVGIDKSYPDFFSHIQQLGGNVCQHLD